MQLTHAFSIKHKDVVSLVGAGGKTTTMFRLAEELVAQNKRVVTTTTTRLLRAQTDLTPFCIYAENREQAIRDLRAALQEHSHVLIVSAMAESEKVLGIEPMLVDEIAALDEVDAVIVEADGARGRPFKAPDAHEPVIPAATTLLVPVIGIDAVGARLDDEHAHRAERITALAGAHVGAVIEAELVARVIAHAQGGLKNRPARARVIPFINKVQDDAQRRAAREIAVCLLQCAAIGAVAIGAARDAVMPVVELRQHVAAIILAAGGSTRMGGALKQLLPWGDSTMVRHAVEVASRAQVAEIIVVIGNQAAQVEKELGGVAGKIVFNPDWAQGRSASIRVGLNALSPNCAAVLFINADQSFLTTRVIDSIVLCYAQTLAPLGVPVYAGETGSPVLFARTLFDELKQLRGENGGKQILDARCADAARVNIPDAHAARDIDTLAEYRAARDDA